jgi:hypothetical protein
MYLGLLLLLQVAARHAVLDRARINHIIKKPHAPTTSFARKESLSQVQHGLRVVAALTVPLASTKTQQITGPWRANCGPPVLPGQSWLVQAQTSLALASQLLMTMTMAMTMTMPTTLTTPTPTTLVLTTMITMMEMTTTNTSALHVTCLMRPGTSAPS